MLDRNEVVKKMEERGFIAHAYTNSDLIHFMTHVEFSVNGRFVKRQAPTINVNVYLENGDFEGIYCVPRSINRLSTPRCGSIMNDDHFNRIITNLETQAKILSRAIREE